MGSFGFVKLANIDRKDGFKSMFGIRSNSDTWRIEAFIEMIEYC